MKIDKENPTLKEYGKFAPYYREVGIKRGHFNLQALFLKEYLIKYNNASVLDASCATGDVLNELVNYFPYFSFTGVDGCQKLLKQARTLFNFSKISFLKCCWFEMKDKLKKESFDVIYFLGNSIGHVSSIDEFNNILNSIYILLKKDGLLIFDLRHWETDLIQMSYNEPNGTDNILYLNNSIVYETNYNKNNHRHHLIHKLRNNNSNMLIENIELSFIDNKNNEIENSIKICRYTTEKIIEDFSKYPFLAYVLKK